MYCNRWARDRVNAICQSLPLTESLADPRIKAPGFGMLFSPASFRYFYPPLLLIAAESDVMNRPSLHADTIARLLNGKARYLSLPGADTGALMSPCPEALAAELPELCRSVSPEERRAIHRHMDDALSDFFLHVLGSGKNLPVIPPPPDLSRVAKGTGGLTTLVRITSLSTVHRCFQSRFYTGRRSVGPENRSPGYISIHF